MTWTVGTQAVDKTIETEGNGQVGTVVKNFVQCSKRKRKVEATSGSAGNNCDTTARNKSKKLAKKARKNTDIEPLGWSGVPIEGFSQEDGLFYFEELEGVDVDYKVGKDGSKMVSFKKLNDDDKESAVFKKKGRDETAVDGDDITGRNNPLYVNKNKIPISTFVDSIPQLTEKQENEIITEKKQAQKEKSKKKRKEKQSEKKRSINAKGVGSLLNQMEEECIVKNTELDRNGSDMSSWQQYHLNPLLLKGLQDLKFVEPTEIQKRVLDEALNVQRDILGAAQTGSGKTLAFGLPMLHNILENLNEESTELQALVLVPTRELAMQVTDHLKAVAKYTKTQIISIVGGLSHQKQRRLLSMGPHIIVATPGRLWELTSLDEKLLSSLSNIKHLVLDEADRMLESGHFRDLDMILEAISLTRQVVKNEWKKREGEKEEDEEFVQKYEKDQQKVIGQIRRTYLFSATLLPETSKLRDDGKKKRVIKKKGKKDVELTSVELENGTKSLADLVNKIEFLDPNPLYINVILEKITAERLVESKIDCLINDKDAYLYYILIRNPGRTLIFLNSIDGIRRLVPLLVMLDVKCWGLHADMQQRQRIKNLERFKSTPNSVLVSSDVSARGLDVSNVQHVIHYQLPRTPDLYIHRSGRTARGHSEGMSVVLCGPDDVKVWKRICRALDKDGVPEFPVDESILALVKERVNLARRVEVGEHKLSKANQEANWLKKAAEEADLTLEGLDDEDENSSHDQRVHKAKVAQLKAELKHKLLEPLIPRGISRSYITGDAFTKELLL